MKRFMFLFVLFVIVCFLATGCGKGEEKAGDTSAEKKIEKKEEAENLYLTEKEVKAFIKAFPVFVEITKKKEKEVEPLTDKEDLISGMKFVGEVKEYKEEIGAALKDYGFTFESFASTYGKVLGAIGYGQMAVATEELMKRTLDNPTVPEEQKEEIMKSLKEAKEAEESEEMKATKDNWEIVKKYEDEIINILEEK